MGPRPAALLLALLAAAGAATATPQPVTVPTGTLVEGLRCLADPTQSYTLFLPAGYTVERDWPVLLIFDPLGRSRHAAEVFERAAGRWGWLLVSSDDTRSDGPWDPNIRALNALWPEIHLRYSVDARRVYAAGLSGGGHVAFVLGRQTGGLAGVIASGSRLLEEELEGPGFAVFSAAGDRDFNFQEMRRVDDFVAGLGNPHRLEVFPGLHEWMPPELAELAVAWLEVEAMRAGLRPRDQGVVADLLADELSAARSLEDTGELLAALRRFATVVRTFDGLADVSHAREAEARLGGSREVARERRAEKRWRSFEQRYRLRFAATWDRLRRGDEPLTASEVRDALGLPVLLARAVEPGLEGATARRLLSTLYAEASYYVAGSLLEVERWHALAALMPVAVEVYDGWGAVWPCWYNLARAHANLHHPAEALRALERAVAEGFSDAERLRSDPHLAPIAGSEELRALVRSLEPR